MACDIIIIGWDLVILFGSLNPPDEFSLLSTYATLNSGGLLFGKLPYTVTHYRNVSFIIPGVPSATAIQFNT